MSAPGEQANDLRSYSMKDLTKLVLVSTGTVLLLTVLITTQFVPGAGAKGSPVGRAIATLATPPQIVSISVCLPANSGGLTQGSCGLGTFDSHQPVLGPSPQGISINNYVDGGISDEHQSIFPPGSLQGNSDYLFFVASRTNLNFDTGLLVLKGKPATQADGNGQWTLDFSKDYGYYPTSSPCPRPGGTPKSPLAFAPIFQSPSGSNCPLVDVGQPSPNPAHQDQTFDLNYAAPGSIVFDPSGGGNMLMIYEGTNTCFGSIGGTRSNGFYSTVGVATSVDYGQHWPTYHDNSSFAFVPLPCQNTTQGPNAWVGPTPAPNGAIGPGQVYEGDDQATTPPTNYGRYAILSPSKSLAEAMASGSPLPGKHSPSMGDAEMSAFVDDVNGDPSPYLYVVYNDNLGEGILADPNEIGGMSIARAQLNQGGDRLSFSKWYKPTPDQTPQPSPEWMLNSGIGGYDTPIFPNDGPGYMCEGAAQQRFGGSLSYVEATHQYLLTFVCTSPVDPVSCQTDDTQCQDANANRQGAAWFYATSDNPADPTKWTQPDPQGHSQPQEIQGSWSWFDSQPQASPSASPTASPCAPSFKGWYPTFMSLGNNPGHLAASGYVFYLHGCQTSDTSREYSSRSFKITTTDTTPPVTTSSIAGPMGLNNWYNGPTTVTFNATDDASGVAQTQYSLDGGQNWSAGTSVLLTESKIYNVQYRSIDVDGNVETPNTISVMLDSKPPFITESADTSIIFNYQPVASVTISGKIKDQPAGVDLNTTRFAVHDEYGRIEPTGSISLAADGSYSFTVKLRTFVRAKDTDGRLYKIKVSATDNAGNTGTNETSVIIKRVKQQPPPPCGKKCV
jgi:hypothetical protein